MWEEAEYVRLGVINAKYKSLIGQAAMLEKKLP
jgi:hypothetical protein